MIEMMVVIAIVGSVMLVLSSLLSDLLNRRLTQNNKVEWTGIFRYARKEAMSKGKLLTLEINMDSREFSLRLYNPVIEAEDSGEQSKSDFLLRPDYSENENSEKEKVFLVPPEELPNGLKEVYSIAGLLQEGPFIYVHFYPDGTSDPVIFHFPNREKPYLFFPSRNFEGMYLKNLRESIYAQDMR